MRHLSPRDQFVAQCAFGSESELVFGRFAVDDELRAARILRCMISAGTVPFFADNKQQAEISHAGVEKTLGRGQHGRR